MKNAVKNHVVVTVVHSNDIHEFLVVVLFPSDPPGWAKIFPKEEDI